MDEGVGDRLKFLRKKYNFTQKDIGDYLGISQSLLAKVESNERNLKLTYITKLSDLYNVSGEYILYGEGVPNSNVLVFIKDNKAIDLKTIARMNKIINNLKEMIKLYESEVMKRCDD